MIEKIRAIILFSCSDFLTKYISMSRFSLEFAKVFEVLSLHKFFDAFEMQCYALVAKFVDVFHQSIEEVAVVAYQN